jgi:Tol biopolymer transport system component
MVLRQESTHSSSGIPSAAISGDGRHLAFVSAARLLQADTNGVDDIYLLDRESRRLTLATVGPGGGASNGTSLSPQLNTDGRYLAFDSQSTILTGTPDRNEANDVFVRDCLTGTTTRVSVGAEGRDGNGQSTNPALSGDGRWLAFESTATNLVAGEDANGTGSDVFLADLGAGTLTRVGVDSGGRQFARAFSPRISGDGTLVVFAATQTLNSSGGRAGGITGSSVYLRDVAAGTTICISCDRGVSAKRLAAFAPDLSADGRIVAFAVPTSQSRSDIVVYDRASRIATTITRSANARSAAPRLSGDGNIVAFESWASNLLCRGRCRDAEIDENLLPDVYLFDRTRESFERASGGSVTWWTPSLGPAIDGTGQVVVFSSREPFGPEDLTSDFDLFVCSPVCS